MLYDFHTHDATPQAGVWKLVSLPEERLKTAPEATGVAYSLQLHPWDTTPETVVSPSFSALAATSKVVALGEIGLDKLRGAPLRYQIALLEQLLCLAEKIRKPVILHCVHADDFLAPMLKKHPAIPGVILHGFRGKPEALRQLLRRKWFVALSVRAWERPDLIEFLKQDSDSLSHCLVESDDSGCDLAALYGHLCAQQIFPRVTIPSCFGHGSCSSVD